MVKRIFFTFISFLLILASNFSVLSAAESAGEAAGSTEPANGISLEEQKMIAPDYIVPPNPGGLMPFAGQNHNYTLIFRGNGESIVTLRVSLTNTSEKSDLNEVSLRIPKVAEPKDLVVYQIILPQRCIRYDDRPVQVYPYTPKCAEYGDPEYDSYYYYPGGGKYQKAEINLTGDTLKLVLPTPIKPSKTGSFFVYFRGFGYAEKTLFGAYRYEFESLKVEDQINQLTIGISTDADQFLKGAKGEVDYRQNEASTAMKALPTAGDAAITNPSIDRFVQQIGYGTIQKTASNLSASESYKVDGLYANSRAKLYGRELLTVFGVILFFLLLVAFVLRAIQKRSFRKENDPKAHQVTSDEGIKRVVLSAGVGFASALVTAGYTLAIYAVANALNNLVDYQYQAVVIILLVVISFAIYLLLILGPAVFIGIKKGIGWGVGTFVMTIVWLILMAIITVAILFIFRQEPYYPPVPLVRSAPVFETGDVAR